MLFQLIWNKANIDKAYLQRGVSIPQQLIGSMARDEKRRDKEVLMGLSFSVGRDVQNIKIGFGYNHMASPRHNAQCLAENFGHTVF